MRQPHAVESNDPFAKSKEAFWKTVRDTLVEIHGMSLPEAIRRVGIVRDRGTSPKDADDDSLDIIYHAEPFDVARNMAGRDVRWEGDNQLYAQIVARHKVQGGEGASALSRRGPYLSSESGVIH